MKQIEREIEKFVYKLIAIIGIPLVLILILIGVAIWNRITKMSFVGEEIEIRLFLIVFGSLLIVIKAINYKISKI